MSVLIMDIMPSLKFLQFYLEMVELVGCFMSKELIEDVKKYWGSKISTEIHVTSHL